MPFLFDAHSHLPTGASRPADHPRVVCGTCEADWEAVLAHAAGDPQVIPMLAMHPWFLREATPNWMLRLEVLLRAHPVGVGECGLDFARRTADREGQIAALRLQLRLARDLLRPVALHVVQAWGPLLDLLHAEGVPPAGAMVHAFSGSAETGLALQAMGVYLSFSGDLLDPARARAQEALKAAHPDLLLLESDGAADLAGVTETAARLRGTPVSDLAARTWENGRRCFKELMA